MFHRQRIHGGRLMWRCKPFKSKLSETKLTCLPSSCRPAGKRLHGCVAGCASCSKSNMPQTVQLPEHLLCHPVTRLEGRPCSIANSFMQTYVQHLLYEVNISPPHLHIFVANEISPATGVLVLQGMAIHTESVSCCSCMCNHRFVLIVAFNSSVMQLSPATCFVGKNL